MSLSADQLRAILSYDAETGLFKWAKPRSRVRVGQVAGRVGPDGYRRIETGGKQHCEHRLAWLYVHGEWPEGEIDHINGMRSDNRIANLRIVTRAENCQCRHNVRSDSKTGVLGASRRGKRFIAEITVNGQRRYLGRFDTAEAAGAAYLAARAS